MALLIIGCLSIGWGRHPAPLASANDIGRVSRDVEQIVIGFLQVGDYPSLKRLHRVRDVSFFAVDGTGASDAKLAAFVQLELTNVTSISLLNCPLVTDSGFRHLANIKSLRNLQLEGTSISDESIEVMTSQMRLVGVNLANCTNVTVKGVAKLARCETLNQFGFSVGDMSQSEVFDVIAEIRSAKWCGIVDLSAKLGPEELQALGSRNGVRIAIMRKGALQNVQEWNAQ